MSPTTYTVYERTQKHTQHNTNLNPVSFKLDFLKSSEERLYVLWYDRRSDLGQSKT